jgi:hypothetical protein
VQKKKKCSTVIRSLTPDIKASIQKSAADGVQHTSMSTGGKNHQVIHLQSRELDNVSVNMDHQADRAKLLYQGSYSFIHDLG